MKKLRFLDFEHQNKNFTKSKCYFVVYNKHNFKRKIKINTYTNKVMDHILNFRDDF